MDNNLLNIISLFSISASLFFVILIVILHFQQPNLDPIGRTISEYILGKNGWLFIIASASIGIAALALFTSIVLLHPSSFPIIGLIFLFLFGLAMIVAAIIPTDFMDPNAPELHLSTAGMIHASAGLLASISIAIAAPLISSWFQSINTTSQIIKLLPVIAIICDFAIIIALITIFAQPITLRIFHRKSIYGLGERIGSLAFTLWLIITALAVNSTIN
jgi:hypothetical protein